MTYELPFAGPPARSGEPTPRRAKGGVIFSMDDPVIFDAYPHHGLVRPSPVDPLEGPGLEFSLLQGPPIMGVAAQPAKRMASRTEAIPSPMGLFPRGLCLSIRLQNINLIPPNSGRNNSTRAKCLKHTTRFPTSPFLKRGF